LQPVSSWRVAAGADPVVRPWGDECVVHHGLSNDTHRLLAVAGHALQALASRGQASAAALAEDCGEDVDEMESILRALEALSLVTECAG
jgi:hypothetical protein